MRYLLDTCVLSDFVKPVPSVVNRLRETSPEFLAISAITVMEIEYGLQLNPDRAKRLTPVMSALMGQMEALDFTQRDAMVAANLRAGLARRGMQIGSYDSLIAATALSRGLTLVTSNVREFGRIAGLRLEDWRAIQ